MTQSDRPAAQDQLEFLLAVERLLADAEQLRDRRNRLLERARNAPESHAEEQGASQ